MLTACVGVSADVRDSDEDGRVREDCTYSLGGELVATSASVCHMSRILACVSTPCPCLHSLSVSPLLVIWNLQNYRIYHQIHALINHKC